MQTTTSSMPCGGKQLTEKITCRLEVLSPVHVGASLTWNEGVDFVQKNNKVYVVDAEKYFGLLQETTAEGNKSGYDVLMQILGSGKTGDVGELCNLLHLDLGEVSDKIFNLRAPANNPIRPVIRTGMGVPYLPGSSIKGAIRSVIFNYIYNRSQRPEYSKYTESDLIGLFDKAITRYIRPFDVEIPHTDIANLRTFNLYLRGFSPKSDYKQNLPMTVEHFQVGTHVADFRLAIDEQWVEKLSGDLRGFLPKNIQYFIKPGRKAIPNLFNLINEYTYTHLKREIEFLNAYPQAEDTEFIIENLEKLRRLCANNGDSCILRLGFGGGYHSITGDWRFEDHTETIENPDWQNKKRGEPTRYKSRKVIGADLDSALMGFIRIWLPEGYERVPFSPRPEIGSASISVVKKSVPEAEIKRVKFSEIGPKTVFFAKITSVSKPFCKVELLIDECPFDLTADLSGVKGIPLQPDQFVEVLVNSLTKEGKINVVSLKK